MGIVEINVEKTASHFSTYCLILSLGLGLLEYVKEGCSSLHISVVKLLPNKNGF